MSQIEDKISGILNNPAEMEKLMKLARSIIGDKESVSSEDSEEGDTAGAGVPRPEPPVATEGHTSSGLNLDTDVIKSLVGGLKGMAGGSDKKALLGAISPYLKKERRTQLERAMNIAKVARLFLLDLGGGSDDV